MQTLTLRTVLLLLAGIGGAHASKQHIEPLILLDQQSRVAACGARVTARDSGDVAVELTWQVLRDAEGPKTILSAGHARAGVAAGVTAISLQVGEYDIARLLSRTSPPTAGRFRLEGRLSAERQGRLFRDFMLAGGSLRLQLDDGTAWQADIRGPAPRDVFRGYLQCSGDLFRSDRIGHGG
jgi:hypothetical protein